MSVTSSPNRAGAKRARAAAAAVGQFADERGISWPRSMAPFDVAVVGLSAAGSQEQELAVRAEQLRGKVASLCGA